MHIRLHRTLITSCAVGLALAAALYWAWPAAAPPAAGPAAQGHAWTWPSGLRMLRPTRTDGVIEADPDFDEVPEGVVRVDDRGQLIVDVQLHNAIDSYLLHADVPSRQIAADKLRAFLQRKLAAEAAPAALALVSNYLAYMAAHDDALGRLRFPAARPDSLSALEAEQYTAWQAQRRSLRLALLGAPVYQEWFAAEDERCAGLLAGARTAAAPARAPESNLVRGAPAGTSDGPAASTDAQQAGDALDCATESVKSFAAIETQERQWTRNWSRYREAVERLGERDPVRRAQQLAALRQQIFSNDAERERAQARNLE